MAVNFTTIKNTNQETVIHFEAAAAITTGTITIASLAASTQARNSDAPKVNILRIITSGEVGSTVQIQRNNKTILVCAPESAPVVDLPAFGISDGTYNDYDIVINNQTAKQMSGYIVLRKVAGWSSKVEDASFGAADNVNQVGA